ncbi:uncharacterized protein LOC132039514 [Lycium ferocissimum]|uniref:uncharacterized protein LOC132039514 n=1 Tax=Lycium ferocissimum TaxID=112874 RepID=UPI002815F1F9|nr:uncharacterized protein LOC132039514 [Lycium ferocissimum]
MEPQHVINMIIGRTEMPRGPMMKKTKVLVVRAKRTRDYVPEGSISFNDKDAEGIIQPHNDALVISIHIFKSQVKRILIDPGSSTYIIQWRVVEQLGPLDQIMPAARVLSRFNMASKTTKGEISLPVNIAETIQQTMIYVIEREMKYNALLGRPWIHSMRVVPSTLHQMLRFPTSEGIKKVRGEQPAAREMFAVEVASPTQREPTLKAVEPTEGKDTK